MTETSVAARVRRRVVHSGDRFWRPDDFEGSPDAVTQALSRLARAGELRRVRRGLYWRGSRTRLGMAPPAADRLVEKVVPGLGIGPAGWSAALALGLSSQVPRRETVAVPGRPPRDPSAVHFVSRTASARRREERLRSVEVALLEVLRDWDTLVEIPGKEAVKRISHLAERGAVRLDRLVRASVSEPPRVRERLRHLLGALGEESSVDAVRRARSDSVRRDVALIS